MRKIAALALAFTLALAAPAQAAITLVANGQTYGTPPTTTISTSGATLAIACAVADGGTNGTVSDNRGNTWTSIASVSTAASYHVEFWYSLITFPNASTAISYSGNFTRLLVSSYSGTATSSVLDGSYTSTTSNFVTSIQPGSITPSQANGLLVTCVGQAPGSTGTPTVNSSFTVTDANASGSDYGGGTSYLVQTSAAGVNPTWSSFSSTTAAAVMQAFKEPGGGGGATTVPLRGLMGVGQ